MDLNAYKAQILTLLPKGAAWRGKNLRDLVGSFAAEVSRLSDAVDGLTVEVIPATTDALLPDYERLVGLPYPGFDLADTVQERRDDVVAVLIAQGGQSKAYFLSIVAARGHVGATITDNFRPLRAGDPCGTPVRDVEWIFHWRVNLTESDPDPLLEYLLERFKPAHTTVSFLYT